MTTGMRAGKNGPTRMRLRSPTALFSSLQECVCGVQTALFSSLRVLQATKDSH